jgi:hypothetical protein
MLYAIALITDVNPQGLTGYNWLELGDFFFTPKFKNFRDRYTVLSDDIQFGNIKYEERYIYEVEQIVIAPIDIIKWAKKRHFSIPDKVEKRVLQNNPEYVDWEGEYKKLEEVNIELKKALESKTLHKTTARGYQELIAILGKLVFKEQLEQFNAHRICELIANKQLLFEVMTENTMRKYLKEPRTLLNLHSTVKK